MMRSLFSDASIWTTTTVAVAMIAVAAVAADAPVSPAEGAPASTEPTQVPAAVSTQSGMPGCVVWTDRCVICQREDGAIACSNIGTACQPQAMLCLRAEAAKEKKPTNLDRHADPQP
jgi:hypothetical protein